MAAVRICGDESVDIGPLGNINPVSSDTRIDVYGHVSRSFLDFESRSVSD